MKEHEGLTEQFEENRNHLRTVAYRMLGSLSEADARDPAYRSVRHSVSGSTEPVGIASRDRARDLRNPVVDRANRSHRWYAGRRRQSGSRRVR